MSVMDNLGFVPVEEIQGVFAIEMKEIEEELRDRGIPHNYKDIIEIIDGIRLKLMMRARRNVKDYLLKNPEVKMEGHKRKEEEFSKSQQEAYEDRVKRNKAERIRQAYES